MSANRFGQIVQEITDGKELTPALMAGIESTAAIIELAENIEKAGGVVSVELVKQMKQLINLVR